MACCADKLSLEYSIRGYARAQVRTFGADFDATIEAFFRRLFCQVGAGLFDLPIAGLTGVKHPS